MTTLSNLKWDGFKMDITAKNGQNEPQWNKMPKLTKRGLILHLLSSFPNLETFSVLGGIKSHNPTLLPLKEVLNFPRHGAMYCALKGIRLVQLF